ncbi:MAG: panthothenate synthetase, partial [Acidobacteriota bacterium]
SKVPALAEPWFLQFNAECSFHIVMTPDVLAKAGLEALGKKWA